MSDSISREDIEELSERLEAFAAGLNDRQRDILATALGASVDEPDDEVSGYSFSSPTSLTLSRTVYQQPVLEGISIKVFPDIRHGGSGFVGWKPVDHD
ncbi:MAG: hypothetical protein U5K29_14145 [Acidimicrobiales bacterium]|nr:hypothetical protein [Acidimicrobiales bacterium]